VSKAVVDTDVISFLFKRDTRAKLYEPHLTGKLLVISFMTIAELDRWALSNKWGDDRRLRMEEHLKNFVLYPFNRELCRKWADVKTVTGKRGKNISDSDAWIAATALLYGIPLITHNRSHFEKVENLTVISESKFY
jgi:tRNA(fMet)-specific endonuclease VapC